MDTVCKRKMGCPGILKGALYRASAVQHPCKLRNSAACGATNFDRSANLPARELLMQPEDFAKAVVETCKLPQHVVVEEITVWGIDQVVVPL